MGVKVRINYGTGSTADLIIDRGTLQSLQWPTDNYSRNFGPVVNQLETAINNAIGNAAANPSLPVLCANDDVGEPLLRVGRRPSNAQAKNFFNSMQRCVKALDRLAANAESIEKLDAAEQAGKDATARADRLEREAKEAREATAVRQSAFEKVSGLVSTAERLAGELKARVENLRLATSADPSQRAKVVAEIIKDADAAIKAAEAAEKAAVGAKLTDLQGRAHAAMDAAQKARKEVQGLSAGPQAAAKKPVSEPLPMPPPLYRALPVLTPTAIFNEYREAFMTATGIWDPAKVSQLLKVDQEVFNGDDLAKKLTALREAVNNGRKAFIELFGAAGNLPELTDVKEIEFKGGKVQAKDVKWPVGDEIKGDDHTHAQHVFEALRAKTKASSEAYVVALADVLGMSAEDVKKGFKFKEDAKGPEKGFDDIAKAGGTEELAKLVTALKAYGKKLYDDKVKAARDAGHKPASAYPEEAAKYALAATNGNENEWMGWARGEAIKWAGDNGAHLRRQADIITHMLVPQTDVGVFLDVVGELEQISTDTRQDTQIAQAGGDVAAIREELGMEVPNLPEIPASFDNDTVKKQTFDKIAGNAGIEGWLDKAARWAGKPVEKLLEEIGYLHPKDHKNPEKRGKPLTRDEFIHWLSGVATAEDFKAVMQKASLWVASKRGIQQNDQGVMITVGRSTGGLLNVEFGGGAEGRFGNIRIRAHADGTVISVARSVGSGFADVNPTGNAAVGGDSTALNIKNAHLEIAYVRDGKYSVALKGGAENSRLGFVLGTNFTFAEVNELAVKFGAFFYQLPILLSADSPTEGRSVTILKPSIEYTRKLSQALKLKLGASYSRNLTDGSNANGVSGSAKLIYSAGSWQVSGGATVGYNDPIDRRFATFTPNGLTTNTNVAVSYQTKLPWLAVRFSGSYERGEATAWILPNRTGMQQLDRNEYLARILAGVNILLGGKKSRQWCIRPEVGLEVAGASTAWGTSRLPRTVSVGGEPSFAGQVSVGWGGVCEE